MHGDSMDCKKKNIKSLFGVTLLPPQLISARDEILMSYYRS